MIRTTVVDAYGGSIRVTYEDGKPAMLVLKEGVLFDRYTLDYLTLENFIRTFEYARDEMGKCGKTWQSIVEVSRHGTGDVLVEGNMCSVYLSNEILDAVIENLKNVQYWYEIHGVI